MKHIHKMFKLARESAVNPDARSFILGAVAIRRDQAVVRSRNGAVIIQSTPQHRRFISCADAHAEVRVLKKAGRGATVFVARVSRETGEYVMSRPCPGCQSRMKALGVKRCYYTRSHSEYGIIDFNGYDIVAEKIKTYSNSN